MNELNTSESGFLKITFTQPNKGRKRFIRPNQRDNQSILRTVYSKRVLSEKITTIISTIVSGSFSILPALNMREVFLNQKCCW